jgi:hypothetical protein
MCVNVLFLFRFIARTESLAEAAGWAHLNCSICLWKCKCPEAKAFHRVPVSMSLGVEFLFGLV